MSETKNVYLNSVNKYNICKNDSNRLEMCNHKTIYKQLVKKKKRKYELKKIKDIERLRHCKPREFWKKKYKKTVKLSIMI